MGVRTDTYYILHITYLHTAYEWIQQDHGIETVYPVSIIKDKDKRTGVCLCVTVNHGEAVAVEDGCECHVGSM